MSIIEEIFLFYKNKDLNHENITKKIQLILDIAKSWGIEYIRFSDLVAPII